MTLNPCIYSLAITTRDKGEGMGGDGRRSSVYYSPGRHKP